MESTERWLYAWMLGSASFGTASLLIPLYVILIGGDAIALGVLAATAGVAGAVGGIGLGRLATTHLRQRWMFLIVLAGAAVVLAVFPFTSGVTHVFVLNGLLWTLFAAAGPALTVLVVSGVSTEAWHRRIARLQVYQGYGWAAGLVLGMGWLTAAALYTSPETAKSTLFWMTAGLAGLAGIMGRHWLPAPEDSLTERRKQRVSRYLTETTEHIRGTTLFLFSPTRLYWTAQSLHPHRVRERFTPEIQRYFAAVAIAFTGIGIFFAPLPIFLSETGYSSEAIFGLYLIAGLGSAAYYGKTGVLLDTYSSSRLNAGGLGVRAILFPLTAGIALFLATTPTGILGMAVTFVLIGISWAVIAVSATTLITRIAPATIRTDALGIYTGITAISGAFGSIIGGAIALHGYLIAFTIAGTLVAIGAGIIVALPVTSSD